MKIDSLNINSIINNINKSNTESPSGYDSFDSMFAKATSSNGFLNQSSNLSQLTQANQQPQASQQPQEYNNNSYENTNIKNKPYSEDDSMKPVPKEVKDALKKAGMSDEELDKIKSLKDLKEKVDPNKLMSVLLSLMNGNFANTNLSNIKDKIGQQIKDMVNADPKKYSNITDQAQLKNKIIDGLFDKVSNDSASGILSNLGKGNSDDLLAKIQGELAAALKDSLKDLKSNEKDKKDLESDINLISKNLNGKDSGETVKSVKSGEKSSDDSSNLNSKNSKGDEDFLKNLLSDGNDKVSRVTNFMSQFNNMKVDNNSVGDLEKVVINKATVNTDMIKALKFMQTNDMKDLVVKINPRQLGEVVIKITMEAGVMKASINTSNKEAYNLINSNLADITNKLQNNDIKIQNLSLNIYNDDTTFFKDGSDGQRRGNEQKGKSAKGVEAIGEDENLTDNESAIDSNVNILA